MSIFRRISLTAVTALLLGPVDVSAGEHHGTKLRVSPSARTKFRFSNRAVSKCKRLPPTLTLDGMPTSPRLLDLNSDRRRLNKGAHLARVRRRLIRRA